MIPVFVLLLILFSGFVNAQTNIPYTSYENQFQLSGKLIQADKQEFPLNGQLDILAALNGTFINYNLDYSTYIPSLFNSFGTASYSENATSKKLNQENLNSTALSLVWTIFTNGIENVQSLFRLTHEEADAMETNLLNYTHVILDSRYYASPQLNSKINALYCELDHPNIKYQIYYDANKLVLIGMNVFLSKEVLQYDFDVSIRADLISTTLKLDKLGSLNEVNLLSLIGGGIGLILIFVTIVVIFRRKAKTVVKGGL